MEIPTDVQYHENIENWCRKIYTKKPDNHVLLVQSMILAFTK